MKILMIGVAVSLAVLAGVVLAHLIAWLVIHVIVTAFLG